MSEHTQLGTAPEPRMGEHAQLEQYKGTIELILGPMFSEKSTELLSRVRRAALANQPALVIKHVKDVRYTEEDAVLTHGGMQQKSEPRSIAMAPIRVVRASSLASVEVRELVVGIDEGQFFPDLVSTCERWANAGHRVIVAALDGDFSRSAFGGACALVPLSEDVIKLRGVCMHCQRRDSAFTFRLGANLEQELIGGRDEYHSVCRPCYFAATSHRAPPSDRPVLSLGTASPSLPPMTHVVSLSDLC